MPKKKKGTSGVEKASNDPIKTRKERGVAGVINVQYAPVNFPVAHSESDDDTTTTKFIL
jgi:hypothetical protein